MNVMSRPHEDQIEEPGAAGSYFPVLPASTYAKRSFNPIRRLLQEMKIPDPDKDKPLIPLSIGDPTTFKNLKAPQVLIKAVQDAVADFANHGYGHSMGLPQARQAVAKYQSDLTGKSIDSSQVCIASGCSGALEIAIKALCSEGDNLLIPRPGFPLYETIALSYGIAVRHYDLDSENDWEVDLKSLKTSIDDKTRAILVNNPSNPCGSVYNESHLRDIIAIASQHQLPIIADEIYADMVFEGSKYISVASLTNRVPVLEVGGVSKVFLVPGFRVGWLIAHDAPTSLDKDDAMALKHVRSGIENLSQILVGANTIVQATLPAILTPLAGSEESEELVAFRKDTISVLQGNAEYIQSRIEKIPGLCVIQPRGAMYLMVGIDKPLELDDIQFVNGLLSEEQVFVLPGTAFGMKNFVRLVTCAPLDILEEACNRIERFCREMTNKNI